MNKSAELSECGRYRYVLRRWWTDQWPKRTAVFVMLNPSTADDEKDDATVRKCIGFAQRWRMDGIVLVNLFAFRSRHPGALLTAPDPVGPENDRRISEAVADPTATVIAAWGANGRHHPKRVAEVCRLVSRAMRALVVTKDGHPGHPLMVSYAATPAPWALEARP